MTTTAAVWRGLSSAAAAGTRRILRVSLGSFLTSMLFLLSFRASGVELIRPRDPRMVIPRCCVLNGKTSLFPRDSQNEWKHLLARNGLLATRGRWDFPTFSCSMLHREMECARARGRAVCARRKRIAAVMIERATCALTCGCLIIEETRKTRFRRAETANSCSTKSLWQFPLVRFRKNP